MTARSLLIWVVLAGALLVPLTLAVQSPLLAYRDPIYIAAGLAGVAALALMVLQPLLAAGALPGLQLPRARYIHRLVGVLLVTAILAHVGGLWMTSPPDAVDALLFRSPTPFSVWGVIAMWAVFVTATLATLRRKLRPCVWRVGHTALAVVIVAGTVTHALLIEGTMEPISKGALCALVILATGKAVLPALRMLGLSPPAGR
ncbi:ferric reductase-like transmembrane domain-containing protein [uncultured Litoreibacter sp.]|uniref:ferric reductase-like transmembrane domain-containing protein n=1 Tax=uncultured Litoreibacter sp. TaxID=1392394 RepID=UPI0026151D5C|nr:ferric reductase-like transmembrane domain-containing protein [uncultured Litoreibacter sp.]